jgi:UDPglucose 6-dehydrogenase
LAQGAEIYAYDPVGNKNFSRIFPELTSPTEKESGAGSISYVASAEAALKGANVCFIFTEWEEIKKVKPLDYKRLMRTPLVYDGRNIYDLEEMQKTGVEYYSIGRN